MLVILTIASVALIGMALGGGLLLVVIGIHRGDQGKRLTGRPGSNSEAVARRLLTGSRGYDSIHDAGEGR